jgi:hypothetical protein
MEKKANDENLQNTKFRMEAGNKNVVGPFINSGLKYYNNIYTESTGVPESKNSMENELKYGDYNYIGPINNGMTNSQYTFISPSNWYPVPPYPPVCVTNKQCTTSPIQISNGQDYMNWIPLEEFDQSRRFTGNMNINVDYVKNVLNNSDGY